MSHTQRDHGGGLDQAVAKYGGPKVDWIDLSTGINPQAYPIAPISQNAWATLPDINANKAFVSAARRFWRVPEKAAVLAVPGCSAAIAKIPYLQAAGAVQIPGPTYNEHAASFTNAGWQISDTPSKEAFVTVHPNNPTGEFERPVLRAKLTVIDESFCDVALEESKITRAAQPGHLVLKSFGKFWGLAGLRLGAVIGDADLIAVLSAHLGPWPVSGPALEIGARALSDKVWAQNTREWLSKQITKLDRVMAKNGAVSFGKVSLFRTYVVNDAQAWQTRFAQAKIWTRTFPYSKTWIRLGVPNEEMLARVEAAL